jgi:hypothetical protein
MNHPRSSVRALALVGALVAGSAFVGCGGSGDDAPVALTEAEFRSQANAICAAADEDVEEIYDDIPESPSEAETTALIGAMMDRFRQMVGDLEDLEPPASLSGAFAEMLEKSRSGLEKVDEAEIEEFNTMENPFTAAGAQAGELELDDCVEFLS